MTTTERSWADVDPLWPPDGPLTPAISPQALAGLAAQAFDAPAPVDTIVPGVTGVPGGLPQAVPVAPRGGGGPIGVGSAPAPYAVHDGFDPAHLPDVRTAYDTPLFDVATLRRDFPILAEQVHGRPLIWLDNAATTQKPRAVIERLTWFYEHENSNIHRAAHELAARATEAYEDARATVRRFVNAPREQEIAFVRGATEGINLVAHAWGTRNLREGDEIVITHLEHHANIVPWQMVARRTGATLQVAPVDDSGDLLMDRFAELLGPRTRLVAVTAVSNALGTVTPLEQIVELAHRVGARVLVDGAQSVPHLPVDLQRVPADFFTFSGHKIFGPTGIGALYVSERVWDETPAWHGGGNMIQDVTLERSTYKSPPDIWEAGTGNIADAVGLGEALKYVERVGIERIAAWEHRLLEHATPRLAAVPGVRLVGTARQKASVLSFVMAGRDPVEVGKQLDAE
ncbi:MAG: cysteine desulfurase, partial [Dermatophilaceae bacterium]